MATPRTAFPPYLRPLLAALIALLGLSLLPPAGVAAAPPQTVAEARRELAELNERVDTVVEDYHQAQLDLATAQRQVAAARARVQRVEQRITHLRSALGSLAAAAYRSGGSAELVQLVTTSTPEAFLDRAASLDQLARHRSEQIAELAVARRELATEEQAARQILDTQTRIGRALAENKTKVETAVRRQEELLRRLEGDQAERLRRAREAAEAAAARRAAVAARRTAPRVAPRVAPRASRAERAPVRDAGPASGRASVAVRAAYAQLGKPYRWGASGPNSFDCSGLTMYVWAKAGVSLPHSSRAQFRSGVRISKSELRPGDLVFYGSPIGHVGIYVGGSRYIAAPQTGDVVGFRDVNRSGWAGAVRL